MLRSQAHREVAVEEEAEDLESGPTGTETSLKTQDKERLQSEEAFLWLLLLASVAECVTTCFVPAYTMSAWGVNIDRSKGVEISLACIQFRSAFLGVFTSYSFMVDHAGDLSSNSFAVGPLYVGYGSQEITTLQYGIFLSNYS
ncbi:hypothetical protein BBO99_00003813 [Phytophthora kernoviae]|uniref:Uncharacterized protein n=2 Tax=Phytophthora kernoviae TaxID=325452 RepID=A0A3R7KVF9_9STRA|nr:hypothetical protein G195_004257 [Phytophthora kernoviae 00238/432]KAG2527607.1 hypothetical protein JM16_003367 [Phytophthora kernoviae]KAG2528885.1 hypothetical protein JM18_003107 [Phytophthora kernoviae]RLN02891.1 hypothetical protein BBI17_003867 [Phytophthora kernoviae]RLN81310.1 hypothetical protein BBO99_00003813 [Phytophthora kernoviae]